MASRMVIILVTLSLITCRGEGQKEQKKNQSEITVISDSTLLFDGKSLDGWEITNFGPQGPVYVSGDKIILGMGDGCTGITWKGTFPRMGYEITLDAMRVAGNDFFCGMTFPVGNSYCSLIIGGWGGATVGLSRIDGKDAAENETTTLHNFDKDKWYHIRLVVTEGSVKSWIDSMQVVDFNIGNKKLSVRPEVELSKPFGITSWNTTASIKNIHLHRMEK